MLHVNLFLGSLFLWLQEPRNVRTLSICEKETKIVYIKGRNNPKI